MLHHLSVQLAEYQERVSQSHAPENSAAPPPAGAKEEGAEEELGGLPSSVQEQNLLLPKVLTLTLTLTLTVTLTLTLTLSLTLT